MSRGGVHNALSRGLLPSALSRALGDAEAESGLERYGETLTPTLNLWQQPEWAYLRSEALWGWENSPAGVAGEMSGAAIVNPTGSGNLIVVENITAYASGAVIAFLLQYTLEATIVATFGLSAAPVLKDTRWAGKVLGRAQFYMGSDPAPLATRNIELIVAAANVTERFNSGLPFVLGPGYGLIVQGSAVNTGFVVSFGYRERKAFPGELE